MRKILFLLLFLSPLIAYAYSGTANTVGGTTYYFSDGLIGTANNVAGTTYYYFNDGTAGTATNVGGATYFNFGNSKFSGQKIDTDISYDYTPYNFDNLNITGNFNLNLSYNEKIILFEDADKSSDYKVYLLLTGTKNEQCKLQTARQYELLKKYSKESILKYIKEKIGTKSATEAINDCYNSIGGTGKGVVSPSIAAQCLQLTNNERNSYLKNANNTYAKTLTIFNTADIYNKCTRQPCSNGYKWNSEKTRCVATGNDVATPLDNISSNDNPIDKISIAKEEKSLIATVDNSLSKRVSGNILLQVEKNGEGWYVYPDNKKKYYLGRPTDAFSIMRNLGLGIKHDELSNYLDTKFPDRLSGKILLDVERNGEAYYINPTNLKGYFLNRPADAFKVMRELGLGISNTDIRKIDIGEIN